MERLYILLHADLRLAITWHNAVSGLTSGGRVERGKICGKRCEQRAY
jgi:hypothetical protein